MLKFEIVSSRIAEGEDKDKKFVAYMLQVRHENKEFEQLDRDPSYIERRYTHFLDLYNGLKKDFPNLLNSISFPRKMVMGNFDPSLISNRCTAFESLLELIANDSRLRDNPATISFLLDVEVNQAKNFMNLNQFEQALTILEISFKLLSKVYTDRSRVVLSVLCRIVACSPASDGALAGPVEKWAQLALRRYEAVSDYDLLVIYVPLVQTCISIWETLGRDKSKLVEELNGLRKKGMKVDSVPSLIEAVDGLDITV